MGYWGEGLFDNDCSRDDLNEMLGPWVKEIEKLLGSSEATEWDEVAPDELAIRMKILLLLHREDFPLENYPRSAILNNNRSQFEEGWREYAAENVFQLKRLETILALWDELTAVSKAWEDHLR